MAAMISTLFQLGGKVAPQQQVVQTQTTADDQKVINQIIEAHKPDANFAVDEKPLLSTVLDILSQATPTPPPHDPKIDSMVPEAKSLLAISEELAFTIHKIGCELSCDCSGGGDMKSITQAVFNTLVKYTWEDKAVIALAAFAVNYGEFCLLSQLQASNPLAKYVVQIKPLPDVNERESLISGLLETITSVIKIVIHLNDLPTQYISRKEPPFSEPEVSNAVYWVVKGIVACSTQSIGLLNVLPYKASITEARKRLTEITHKLKKIHGNLTTMLDQCSQKIKDKKENEGYYNIKKVIDSSHPDNMEIFIELIQTTDNTPLFNGVPGRKESLNVLKSKTVILFISNLDISDEEIKEIEHQVGKPGKQQYEIVWLPIFDKEITPKERQEIGKKASSMKWYSLHFSITLQPYVVKYIKQDWQFEKKPMMVVFDGRGKVVNSNAYHMIMIWGSAAYPFNTTREETLWKGTDFSLDFLIGDKELVNEGKVTYLYGGDDLDWIRKFIVSVKDVVKGDGITVELIYVGTKHRDTILKENLSTCWDELQIRRFRARLERIWYSKMHLGKPIADTRLKYLTMLRGADGSGHPWTMVGQGPKEVVAVNGNEMVEILIELKNKKVSFPTTDFIGSLLKAIREIIFPPPGVEIKPKPKPKPHCYHIEAPSTNGIVQESMVCTDCNRPMEKTIMFKCCIKE